MMKTKPVMLVVITLIIGFVLGMLTSAQIRYHKLKPVRVFFSEERFREGFYHIINPDEQQKIKIDNVLDKYAKINEELQRNFRKELDSSMNSFRKEMDSYLTKEQQSRLKDMDRRREEMIKQKRKSHENDTINGGSFRRHNWGGERPSPDGAPPMSPPPPYDDSDTVMKPLHSIENSR